MTPKTIFIKRILYPKKFTSIYYFVVLINVYWTEMISEERVNRDELMVSFDVKSLFTCRWSSRHHLWKTDSWWHSRRKDSTNPTPDHQAPPYLSEDYLLPVLGTVLWIEGWYSNGFPCISSGRQHLYGTHWTTSHQIVTTPNQMMEKIHRWHVLFPM